MFVIDDDLETGRYGNRVVTRFPPEPNGYLHIGHAKSICLNFGLAKKFNGRCHLRFDDTNPVKEDEKYAVGIQEDIKWLGFDWGENLFYASDYFDQLYAWSLELIEKGLAYVDECSADEIKEMRGTVNEPGKNSPYRDRPAEESKALLEKMKNGEFEDGSKVLRAKIDMSSGNMFFRDPILYRIRNVSHPRTGDTWKIYPMYDFAHGQSDALEHITHSLCSLEFEAHRPLYDWFLEKLPVPSRPRQYEFARLRLDYTVMSKRKLLELVEEGHVEGWDDPRMPTLRGMRRRGFPPEAIRNFCDEIGVTRKHSVIALSTLETCVRDVMDRDCERAMAVIDPIKVVITNYPEQETEILQAKKHPKNEEIGRRDIPFGREIYIDRDDFSEDPPPKFHRLKPGGRVRLRYAYVIEFEDIIKDESGEIKEIRCKYLPETKGGKKPEGGGKIKGGC